MLQGAECLQVFTDYNNSNNFPTLGYHVLISCMIHEINRLHNTLQYSQKSIIDNLRYIERRHSIYIG